VFIYYLVVKLIKCVVLSVKMNLKSIESDLDGAVNKLKITETTLGIRQEEYLSWIAEKTVVPDFSEGFLRALHTTTSLLLLRKSAGLSFADRWKHKNDRHIQSEIQGVQYFLKKLKDSQNEVWSNSWNTSLKKASLQWKKR